MQTLIQQQTETDPLVERIGAPSQLAVSEFIKAGMVSVQQHTLTVQELAKVRAALESLPSLNKDALQKHLHQLSFVDGIPGEGTGLTSPASEKGKFDMTFRASLIDESLSSFLTTKERRVYTDDKSGTVLTITGTGADALTYVLLHESSHVLDGACGIVKRFPNLFDRDIWLAEHQLQAPLVQELATSTYFHGGARLPLGRAAEVYDSLAKTPFISLYATASAREDFAELVAWRELQQEYGATLTIRVSNPSTQTFREWRPYTFPALKERFAQIDELQRQMHGCPTG